MHRRCRRSSLLSSSPSPAIIAHHHCHPRRCRGIGHWCPVIVVSCIVAVTVVIAIHVVVVAIVVQVLGVHVVVLMVIVALSLVIRQCGVERPIFIILAWTRHHRGGGSSRWSWWWLRRRHGSHVVHAGRHPGGGDSRIVDAGGDPLLSCWSLLS